MKLADFDFDLPEELIATRPAKPRSASRLLYATCDHIADMGVTDLPDLLRAGDRLVLNNTKVIPARLVGHRRRGDAEAKIEVTLLQEEMGHWRALAKPLRKVELGEMITFSQGFAATVMAKTPTDLLLKFGQQGPDFDAAILASGAMPLPPYIAARRKADAQDNVDYQTVFAKNAGAVAAPTASLHFDHALFDTLRARGIAFTEVTLHVGAGTFLPVKVEDVTTHKMHAEWGEVSAKAAEEINETKGAGGRIIPVGTTALRLIESAGRSGKVAAWSAPTDIFIYPGFDFQICDGLMTNFHLPKSTLLMLISALMGKARVDQIYAHAIAQRYRFFSYGDASLLIP